MKLISVYSPKGGVGKTTLAINLAGAYASEGQRVLVCDVDEQESAYDIYKHTALEQGFSVMAGLPQDKPDVDVMIIDHHPTHQNAPFGGFVVCPIEPNRLSLDSYSKAKQLFTGKKSLLVVNKLEDSRLSDHRYFCRFLREQGIPFKRLDKRNVMPRTTNQGKTVFSMGKTFGAAQMREQINIIKEVVDNELS